MNDENRYVVYKDDNSVYIEYVTMAGCPYFPVSQVSSTAISICTTPEAAQAALRLLRGL